jgi:hypothetical protein
VLAAQGMAYLVEQARFSGGHGSNFLCIGLNLRTACAILLRWTNRPPKYTALRYETDTVAA